MVSMHFLNSSASRAPSCQPTNTVAVTPLPKSFFEPVILELLYAHFSSFGPINQWVALPGFSRILVVYEEEDHAESAKVHSDPIVLNPSNEVFRSEHLILRVYRADRNPLIPKDERNTVPERNYLQPPPVEKNFLISPPGSPPIGWEAVPEEPPNPTPLADDLISALRRLQVQQDRRSSVEVLIEPDDENGLGVYLENVDAATDDEAENMSDSDWVYGVTAPSQTRWRPAVTALPPMRAFA